MLYFCKDITEIDLSNFDTSKVTDMKDMFVSCSSLTLLDLSNLNTSIVTNMEAMFNYCSSLTLLDLSNFNTSKVTNMGSMFHSCSKLKYINLKNFIEKENLNVTNIFYGVPDDIIICLNENSKIIRNQTKNSFILNCSVFDKEINSISCYNISLNEQLCIKCNKDYYEIENDTTSSEKGFILNAIKILKVII